MEVQELWKDAMICVILSSFVFDWNLELGSFYQQLQSVEAKRFNCPSLILVQWTTH